MSQPGPNNPPGALDEAAQQQLIQEIGRVIVRALPPGWQEATVEYRAIGPHSELVAQLLAPNGTVVPIAAPSDATELFTRLRHGMYRPERGTWISAQYRLQRPGSYSVDFNGDFEPAWRAAPDGEAHADELRRYPRAAANIPAWLARAAGAPAADPALRTAEVFDGNGRPITERPSVGPEDHEQVLAYLERAPIVLAARSYDADKLDPERGPAVPLTFHTDGRWIWPGAAGYYLRAHGVAPEPDLLAHIRGAGFRLPEVDERTRELAVALITGEAQG
ncbi:hypothetical protein A8924_4262 [Saccharopolyspora erythraea NRRL 2338]|uniref:Uncharacterized protein n=2 Tax=Saccharopolyspora erythraea TaxID=1836 RepID=A4FGH0_SACEN|nr:hypothetical protein [Saccharopolyspora erythraea]EQD83957.1 hypothetical protein N599_22610 [Saccharopolyspora erythraea D]PFG96850.1 hypothetical protein A8924_4262 [Saccharopolyspora erythraea NRRL 2338]QRK87089.1 hypothetical protein JQX30_19710 [Saccharopolyspora erythraea]CAM03145.1 hypothetical protein SACE_3874 [Saccharopolyspora erythraea NRRL 2338]